MGKETVSRKEAYKEVGKDILRHIPPYADLIALGLLRMYDEQVHDFFYILSGSDLDKYILYQNITEAVPNLYGITHEGISSFRNARRNRHNLLNSALRGTEGAGFRYLRNWSVYSLKSRGHDPSMIKYGICFGLGESLRLGKPLSRFISAIGGVISKLRKTN